MFEVMILKLHLIFVGSVFSFSKARVNKGALAIRFRHA